MSRPIDLMSVRQMAKQLGLSLYIYRKLLDGEAMTPANARKVSQKTGVPLAQINIKVKKASGLKRCTRGDMEYCRQWNKAHPNIPDWSEQLHIELGH